MQVTHSDTQDYLLEQKRPKLRQKPPKKNFIPHVAPTLAVLT
jgi:hypothetical protein